jgi:hypothetical protein
MALPNLLLVLVAATAIYSVKGTDLKETKLSLYLQDISAFGAANATAVPVAGIAGKAWRVTQFGTLYVTDDNITETGNPRSKFSQSWAGAGHVRDGGVGRVECACYGVDSVHK